LFPIHRVADRGGNILRGIGSWVRWAEAGMDKFTVARFMGHSSPRVAERYYIHVTEPHVTTGFERFVTYLERQLVDSVPAATNIFQ